MADLALRTLEREAATGNREAEVRLLSARLRAGELHPDRLSLATAMGHSVARELLGPDAPVLVWSLPGSRGPRRRQRRFWARLVRIHGKPPAVLGAFAAFRALPGVLPEKGLRLRAAIEDWLACPCEEHERKVRKRPLSWPTHSGSLRLPMLVKIKDAITVEDGSHDWRTFGTISTVGIYSGYRKVTRVVRRALIDYSLSVSDLRISHGTE